MREKKEILPVGALILIILGSFWFAQDMGWISSNISWWPLILIAVGIGILVNNYYK
jgi:hypothetical protein